MQFRGSSLKQVNSFLTDYDSSLYGISFSIGRFVWLFFFFCGSLCSGYEKIPNKGEDKMTSLLIS